MIVTGLAVNLNQRSLGQRTGSTFSAWRWWLPPAVVSLVLILAFVDPFIGDWDAVEYTLSAINGYPSSMALGRILFIFYNHTLYVGAHSLFGVSAQHAYLIFKYVVVMQGPMAVIAGWVLTRDLSGSVYSATVSSLLIAASPLLVLYAGQVMTDVPAVLMLTVALVVHLRGVQRQNMWLVLAGAALLGVGVNLRETIAFYLPWLLLAPFVGEWPWRRLIAAVGLSVLVFAIFALGPFAYFFISDHSYRAAWFGWRESMRTESSLHPATLHNLKPWLAFLFASAPLILIAFPFALVSEWRRKKLSPILLLALVGLFADLLLLFNYSTGIGWRYLLTGLPAMAPLSATFAERFLSEKMGRRKALIAIVSVIALVAIACGVLLLRFRRQANEAKSAQKDYSVQLSKVPRNAVMLSGSQTIAVIYWRGVGTGDWEVIGTGAGWPTSQLGSVIDNYLKEDKRVFLDTDPRWWQPCGWHVPEIEELATLEPQFHFRRVAPVIYEIRAKDDPSATDRPDLKALLPENRSGEAKKCLN